jgi:hypothetical protein
MGLLSKTEITYLTDDKFSVTPNYAAKIRSGIRAKVRGLEADIKVIMKSPKFTQIFPDRRPYWLLLKKNGNLPLLWPQKNTVKFTDQIEDACIPRRRVHKKTRKRKKY